MLRLRNISKTRGSGSQRFTLRVPHLDLHGGQRVAVVGASGSGKSTLLDLLALVLAPDRGGEMSLRYSHTEEDIAALWQADRQEALARLRSRALGYVLQTGGLLGFLSVHGNISLSRQLLNLRDDGSVQRLAEQLEIADQLGKKPAALSVGQRQRVSIARALAHRPALVLADEPTASLDPLNARRVMQLLLEQASARGAGLLLTTHDVQLAYDSGLRLLSLQVTRDSDGGVTATLHGANH